MRGLFALCQALNDFTKGSQGQVDGFQFKQVLLIHTLLLANLLATSQIAKVQFSSKKHSSVVSLVALN